MITIRKHMLRSDMFQELSYPSSGKLNLMDVDSYLDRIYSDGKRNDASVSQRKEMNPYAASNSEDELDAHASGSFRHLMAIVPEFECKTVAVLTAFISAIATIVWAAIVGMYIASQFQTNVGLVIPHFVLTAIAMLVAVPVTYRLGLVFRCRITRPISALALLPGILIASSSFSSVDYMINEGWNMFAAAAALICIFSIPAVCTGVSAGGCIAAIMLPFGAATSES